MSSSTICDPVVYGFAGRQYDEESGLYYNRARMYDPNIGRFTSVDPMGLSGGPNLYAYVDNSPLNLVDPSGEIVIDATPDQLTQGFANTPEFLNAQKDSRVIIVEEVTLPGTSFDLLKGKTSVSRDGNTIVVKLYTTQGDTTSWKESELFHEFSHVATALTPVSPPPSDDQKESQAYRNQFNFTPAGTCP